MSKDFKGNHNHLTLSDRIFIEQEISQGHTFRSIARALNKDPSTISKEIRLHAMSMARSVGGIRCRLCNLRPDCTKRHACGKSRCHNLCRDCRNIDVTQYCVLFIPMECDRLARPPYVCNGCNKLGLCELDALKYSAKVAQDEYESTLSSSRAGINLIPEELIQINDLISPLILKGQPLSHIFAVHSDEIPVCRRTLYNYFSQGIFTAKNIDLPRRVRYKKRRTSKNHNTRRIQQAYRNKRTYKNFEFFLEQHPGTDVVEMDTVHGNQSSGKCLLTLLFRSCSFMLAFLLPRCTQEYVISAINSLTEVLGISTFRKYFPVILTDNGPEFKNPYDIERTQDGRHRTYVFYCDPYISNQKGRLEKNHEYIRYVIPKGRSMHRYSQEDINKMMSHINSVARDSLNGACPFDLAELLLDKKIPALTGQSRIAPDDVMLKPALINKRDDS